MKRINYEYDHWDMPSGGDEEPLEQADGFSGEEPACFVSAADYLIHWQRCPLTLVVKPEPERCIYCGHDIDVPVALPYCSDECAVLAETEGA